MIEVLSKQYALTRSAREVVLNFIETHVRVDLNTSVPAYQNQTVCYLLGHTASCYFHWLAYYALQYPAGSIPEQGFTTIGRIRELYKEVDHTVTKFLKAFDNKMEEPVTAIHSGCGLVTATPLQVFTHVLTHEFHHKGQIMFMCRALGYPPPDTDVSNFFA